MLEFWKWPHNGQQVTEYLQREREVQFQGNNLVKGHPEILTQFLSSWTLLVLLRFPSIFYNCVYSPHTIILLRLVFLKVL